MSDTPKTDAFFAEMQERMGTENYAPIALATSAALCKYERNTAELLAQLRFAVRVLEGLLFFRGTAQVDSMKAAIAKAEGK